MMILGHVQALFSHLEDYLRNGDLLPGPNMHRLSTEFPAYEFPTGDPNVRALARKLRQRDEWLLCAWAADGPSKRVTVTIPELGEVKLQARPCGSVYRAWLREGKPVLRLVDRDEEVPTAGL
jgi:hypothetical protein